MSIGNKVSLKLAKFFDMQDYWVVTASIRKGRKAVT